MSYISSLHGQYQTYTFGSNSYWQNPITSFLNMSLHVMVVVIMESSF